MVLDSSIGVILILLCVATLYPFWYVVVVSLSSPAGIAKSGGFMLWPQGFNLDAYKAVIASSDIWIGFRNSIIYVVAGTTLSVVLTVLLAYPLSKSQLWGRKPLMLLISVTMFFSGGLMPSYILISKILDIDGTMLVMILPGAISTYNMLMMRTYFQGLPKELEESAQIDGASSMKVLIKIILPLSLPSVAVIALFYAVGLWNAWFSANLYLSQQRDLWPLALYMREVLVQGNVNSVQSQMSGAAGGAGAVQIAKSLKMATTVVSTVPILVVYPFVQRYFTQGVVMGAIKE
ncbi:carbohydrate ABC transporter permease [Lachnotalea sp. AF33-28]|nr:carbohydrate ABC transporter permease [Lachnotalea sp. AF33-28]